MYFGLDNIHNCVTQFLIINITTDTDTGADINENINIYLWILCLWRTLTNSPSNTVSEKSLSFMSGSLRNGEGRGHGGGIWGLTRGSEAPSGE